MKIAYISNSIIPSKAANSIHVMKMCQAFADNGHEVILLAPDRKSEYEKKIDDVYDFYGVKKNFVLSFFFVLPKKKHTFFLVFFFLIVLISFISSFINNVL